MMGTGRFFLSLIMFTIKSSGCKRTLTTSSHQDSHASSSKQVLNLQQNMKFLNFTPM